MNWRVATIGKLLEFAISEAGLCEIVARTLIHRGKLRPYSPTTLLEFERILSGKQSTLHQKFYKMMVDNAAIFSKEQLHEMVQTGLQNPDIYPRVLELAAELNSREARVACREALGHRSTVVVRHAISALIKMGSAAILENLPAILRHSRSKNRAVRRSVCIALRLLDKSEEIQMTLESHLTDPERTVRREALISLVTILGDEARSSVLLALTDTAPLVRVEACKLLTESKYPGVTEALLERFHDSSTAVRAAAFKSLAVLDRNLAFRNAQSVLDAVGDARVLLREIGVTQEELARLKHTSGSEDFLGGLVSVMDLGDDEISLYIGSFNGTITDEVSSNTSCDVQRTETVSDHKLYRALYCGKLTIGTMGGNYRAFYHALDLCKELTKYPETSPTLIRLIEETIVASRRHTLYNKPDLVFEILQICRKGHKKERILAQAYFIGLLEGKTRQWDNPSEIFHRGFGGVQADMLCNTVSLRTLTDVDEGFMSFLRNLQAAQKTHNENPGVIKTGIGMVWMPITRNLLCWCRLRATPCCLGFILTQFEANESPPNPWQTIETSPCLSEPTTYLLKKYTSFRSAKTIIEHIGQQWFSGGLTESDPEVEVLFGMGEPSIVALKDECQKNLFLRLAN